MPTYRVQVSIPMYTGLPEDVVTNTLYLKRLDAGPATDVDWENLLDHLKKLYEGFYGGRPSGTNTMARYMDNAVTKVRAYDLSDPTPRPPKLDVVLNLNLLNRDTTNSVLPNEVALCLSFKSEPVAGVAAGSTRGRIYLGGLGNGFNGAAGTGFPRPTTAALGEVADSALEFFNSCLDDEWGWVVHSEKLDEDYAVADIWVDNTYDTQRRRGVESTLRVRRTTPEGP